MAIVVHKDHVNLEFAHGIELLDPDGMLDGTGQKMRHVKIRNSEEIESKKNYKFDKGSSRFKYC